MENNKTSTDILLVEDEDILRESVERFLTTLKFNVISCSDGEQALKVFNERLEQNDPIKVVITDMAMPNMNGLDLIKHIAQTGVQTAFIVCSAYDEITDNLCQFPCVRRIHRKPLELSMVVQDIISIFMNKEWERIPLQLNKSEVRICRSTYKVIEDILLKVVY